MPKPNLFDYATKELSQDAIICWLIKWSGTQAENESEQALREVGHAFVDALLAKHGATLTGSVRCTEIHQQNLGIDVLARVRDEDATHVLLIEDKTDSDEHSNQIERYYQKVLNGDSELGKVRESSVRSIFLKTGNQSLYKDCQIELRSKYKVFGRREFLDVLNSYPGDYPIVTDFREYLERFETAFTGYRRWGQNDDRGDWSWGAWEGFFRFLDCRLENTGWGYVPRGGFLGFWWQWVVDVEDADALYLQLEIEPGNPEKQKLCFKVERGDHDGHQARDRYHNAVLAAGEGRVVRPARMRVGKTMTVGVWDGDWLAFNADAWLDVERTVGNLKEAEQIIKAAGTSS